MVKRIYKKPSQPINVWVFYWKMCWVGPVFSMKTINTIQWIGDNYLSISYVCHFIRNIPRGKFCVITSIIIFRMCDIKCVTNSRSKAMPLGMRNSVWLKLPLEWNCTTDSIVLSNLSNDFHLIVQLF